MALKQFIKECTESKIYKECTESKIYLAFTGCLSTESTKQERVVAHTHTLYYDTRENKN